MIARLTPFALALSLLLQPDAPLCAAPSAAGASNPHAASTAPLTRADIAAHMPTERPSLFITRAEADAILTRAQEDTAYANSILNGILANAQKAYDALAPEVRNIPRKEDTNQHQRVIIRNLHSLALGSLFTDAPAYTQRAAEVLLEYASFYPDIKPRRSSAGRLTAQSLNEAMTMVQLAQVYDIVAPTLTPEQAATIETNLLRNAADLLMSLNRGKSNWQTWHNAALATIGLAIREPAYVEQAIFGPVGFLFQRDTAIKGDGLWYELAISYHHFTMQAITLLLEVCARAGINLYQDEPGKDLIEAFYLAPIYYAYSNLNQAPFHDSHPGSSVNNGGLAWNFPYAWAQYDNPALLWIWQTPDTLNTRLYDSRIHPAISQNFIDTLSPEARTPVIFEIGTDNSPSNGSLRNVLGSTLFADSGIGILRGPAAAKSPELSLIWKPNGTEAGHIQPNNLAIDWQSPAHRWLSASGKWAGYSTDIHTQWVNQTLSDNTLVVDGLSQKPGGDKVRSWMSDKTPGESAGKLYAFTNGTTFGYLRAGSDLVYPGVNLVRQLIHTDHYTLDIYAAHSAAEHRYDWVLHITGTLASANVPLLVGKPLPDSGVAYSYLENLRQANLGAITTTYWQEPNVSETFALTTFAQPDTGLTIATSPWAKRDRSTLILSRHTANARFINLWRTFARTDTITNVQWNNNATEAVITLASGNSDYLRLGTAGDASAPAAAGEVRLEGAQTSALSYVAAGMLARLDPSGTAQSATLLGGTMLNTDGLVITTAAAANWSWQRLDATSALLLYDGETATTLTLKTTNDLQVSSIADEAAALTPLAPNADGTWTLRPFTNYLISPAGKDAPALPQLQKRFSADGSR